MQCVPGVLGAVCLGSGGAVRQRGHASHAGTSPPVRDGDVSPSTVPGSTTEPLSCSHGQPRVCRGGAALGGGQIAANPGNIAFRTVNFKSASTALQTGSGSGSADPQL